jgi:hypothetical protein
MMQDSWYIREDAAKALKRGWCLDIPWLHKYITYKGDPSLLLLVVFVSMCSHLSSTSSPSHLFRFCAEIPFFLSIEDSLYMFRTCMMTAPDENLSIPKRSMAP